METGVNCTINCCKVFQCRPPKRFAKVTSGFKFHPPLQFIYHRHSNINLENRTVIYQTNLGNLKLNNYYWSKYMQLFLTTFWHFFAIYFFSNFLKAFTLTCQSKWAKNNCYQLLIAKHQKRTWWLPVVKFFWIWLVVKPGLNFSSQHQMSSCQFLTRTEGAYSKS